MDKSQENTNTAKASEFVSVCEQWNPASQTNHQADHLRSRTSSVVTTHGPIPQRQFMDIRILDAKELDKTNIPSSRHHNMSINGKHYA